MSLVTIEPKGDRAEVRFSFNDIAVRCLRGIPGRLWQPETKCWTVPASSINHLGALLRRQGFDVEILGAIGSGGWADALMRRVNCDKSVYRRLSQTFHPDSNGGDGRMQQELNDGYRRCCGRR